jgi:hypothetical protein
VMLSGVFRSAACYPLPSRPTCDSLVNVGQMKRKCFSVGVWQDESGGAAAAGIEIAQNPNAGAGFPRTCSNAAGKFNIKASVQKSGYASSPKSSAAG